MKHLCELIKRTKALSYISYHPTSKVNTKHACLPTNSQCQDYIIIVYPDKVETTVDL